jgi:predicted nucleotidyltransferase
MKKLKKDLLTQEQFQALAIIQRRLREKFQVEAMILYGSAARGEAGEESDIDLLILTQNQLSRSERHQITGIVFEVSLEYDTNFSTLVVTRSSWESGLFSVLPIRQQIIEDGIAI